jgi:phosphonate metabolism-associated iron-containing alcohol dehydrogenase
MWSYHHPVRIRWCHELAEGLGGILPPGRGLLLASRRFLETRTARQCATLLGDPVVYTDSAANPSPRDMQHAIDSVRDSSFAWVVAIGGGSVIDTAKAVRLALATRCWDVGELITSSASSPRRLEPPLVAVPTTHGTGAELTPWGTIWDKEAGRKLSLNAPGNFPDHAIYCPALTSTLPLPVSVATTLDAFSHALEALWNRNANPIADEMAIAAVRLIHRHLSELTSETSAECRGALLQASLFAGLAFSSTRTAAAHSISYPLTARFDIPHGIACSLPLAALWEINAPSMGEKASRLLEAVGVPTAEVLFRDIHRRVAGKVPFSLADYGVGSADIERLSRESFTEGRMENNLVDLDEEDVRSILRTMLSRVTE